MAAILVELFKHNVWANLRLLDACAGLSDEQLDATVPGTFGNIRATLNHIVGAEAGYVARLTGEQTPARPERLLGVDELRELARRSGETLIRVAIETQDDRVLTGTWRGRPFAIPASVFLTQAINHATDHRSQVATILSQQGITPPDLDAWAYNAEMGGQ